MIILEQSGVKASDEKTWLIIAEREPHRKIEDPCQKRKYKCSEKIRAESDKSSVEQIRSSSVVQKDTERGEDPTREGRQTTSGKYIE